jgi:prefoldin subunit 5
MGTPTVTVSGYLGVDPNAPLKRQVERLVALVNQLSEQLDKLQTEVLQLDKRIDHVIASATKGLEDAIAQIRGEIEQLTARMDRYQVLDLRWAIAGLAITVIGIALIY